MKILLLGVFTRGSTDTWKLLALRRLGHRVFPFAYRDRDVAELNALGEPWDLVFVSKGVPLPIYAFERLASIAKARLLWWPDPFENWTAECSEAVRQGWKVSATSSVVLSKIQAEIAVVLQREGQTSLDLTRFARILEGADCEGPRPEWAPREIRPALLHFGHLSERRVAIIERLRAAGVQVDHLEEPLYGAALQRKVLEYAAVLGVNTSPDLYSNRVQTVLAMGGRILQESAPDLSQDFLLEDAGLRLVTWNEATLMNATAWAFSRLPTPEVSRAEGTFERHRWERAMERVLAFACPQEVSA